MSARRARGFANSGPRACCAPPAPETKRLAVRRTGRTGRAEGIGERAPEGGRKNFCVVRRSVKSDPNAEERVEKRRKSATTIAGISSVETARHHVVDEGAFRGRYSRTRTPWTGGAVVLRHEHVERQVAAGFGRRHPRRVRRLDADDHHLGMHALHVGRCPAVHVAQVHARDVVRPGHAPGRLLEDPTRCRLRSPAGRPTPRLPSSRAPRRVDAAVRRSCRPAASRCLERQGTASTLNAEAPEREGETPRRCRARRRASPRPAVVDNAEASAFGRLGCSARERAICRASVSRGSSSEKTQHAVVLRA